MLRTLNKSDHLTFVLSKKMQRSTTSDISARVLLLRPEDVCVGVLPFCRTVSLLIMLEVGWYNQM